MPKVTFLHSGGRTTTVEAQQGETLLKIALDAGVPMEHACGGNGFCTTCLCSVQKGKEALGPRTDREEGMGITEDPQRLGCQTTLHGDVTVEVLET